MINHVFILAVGMAEWSPETWTGFIVGTFMALLVAKNQWDVRQSKKKIDAQHEDTEKAKKDITHLSTQTLVMDAKVDGLKELAKTNAASIDTANKNIGPLLLSTPTPAYKPFFELPPDAVPTEETTPKG